MAKNFKQLSFKDKLSYILCIASFTVGVVLTMLGMFINPLGEIHSSVLTSLGIFLSFAGALIGINSHYSTQLENFKSEIRAGQTPINNNEENTITNDGDC